MLFDGKEVGLRLPYECGFGDHYVQEALKLCSKFEDETYSVPERIRYENGSWEPPRVFGARVGIEITYNATDVEKRHQL